MVSGSGLRSQTVDPELPCPGRAGPDSQRKSRLTQRSLEGINGFQRVFPVVPVLERAVAPRYTPTYP